MILQVLLDNSCLAQTCHWRTAQILNHILTESNCLPGGRQCFLTADLRAPDPFRYCHSLQYHLQGRQRDWDLTDWQESPARQCQRYSGGGLANKLV